MSNSLEAQVCITEDCCSPFDSQEYLLTSQSQGSDKENVENSSSQDSLSMKKTHSFNSLLNKNKRITDILELVEKQHNCYGQKWGEFGIRKAISVIKNHPKKIKSGKNYFLEIFI